MFIAWVQTGLAGIIQSIRSNVASQLTFANNTPLEEVSKTMGTLYGGAVIRDNKLVQTNTNADYFSWPAVSFAEGEDFTVEAWINYSATGSSTRGGIVGLWNVTGGTAGNAWNLYISGSSLTFSYSTDGKNGPTVAGATVPKNVDAHVAVTRQAGVIRLWLNGNQVGGTATYTGALASTRQCSTNWNTTNSILKGSIWNIRIAKGESYYNSSFIPPTTY